MISFDSIDISEREKKREVDHCYVTVLGYPRGSDGAQDP